MKINIRKPLSIIYQISKVSKGQNTNKGQNNIRGEIYLMGPYNAGPNLTPAPLTPALITPVSNCPEIKKVDISAFNGKIQKITKGKGTCYGCNIPNFERI